MVAKGVILAAAGLVAAGVTLAPPAQADEQSYLNQLSNEGFYGPISVWMAVGYGVCRMSVNGATVGQMTRFVYENTGVTVGVAQSERVVELANIYLC